MNDSTAIGLFVYNRPFHTQKVIEGLKRNNIKKLFIFSDGYKSEKDRKSVKKVRKIIKNVNWCETSIIAREKNIGLSNSIIKGVNFLFKEHNQIIILEDDCLPSNDFIDFMEVCLKKYRNNKKIMNISGYKPPIKIPKNYNYDVYFTYRSSSWGWGTWKDAWEKFNRDPGLLKKIKESSKLRKNLKKAGKDLVYMFKKNKKGEIDSWSVFWSLSIIKNNGVCVNSVENRIKNIGLDGTGIHCSQKKEKNNIKLDIKFNKLRLPDNIEINKKIINSYMKYYDKSFKYKIKNKVGNLYRRFSSLLKIN